MRLNAPRIPMVPQDQWTPQQAALAAPMVERDNMLNIFRTLLTHPDAMSGFMGWASYVLSKRNALPRRDREIVVLRIGYLCRSGYEWTQHVEIGLKCGLTEAEVAAIKTGAEASNWTPAESALIRAADDLHRDQFVSDSSWKALSAHYDMKQCMDVVFTAAQYTQVSMILNSFGVQLDPGQVLDPDLRKM